MNNNITKIDYLDINEFNSQYPILLDHQLAEGTEGDVYLSKNGYAIKKFKAVKGFATDVIQHTIKEVNIYSLVSHPCILKPLYWTFDNGIGYTVMPLGIDIEKAYNEKQISIEEIVSDTVSAISYLCSEGLAHCDIKPSNMIYHDGKAKIIDMGFARKAKLGTDAKYYISSTPRGRGCYLWPDNDFYSREWNSVSSEQYPLALAYYGIVTKREQKMEDNFKTEICHLDWFLKNAQLDDTVRLSIDEILKIGPKELIVRTYKSVTTYIASEFKWHDIDKDWMEWTIDLGYDINIKAETLFLTFSLMHRYLNSGSFNYKEDVYKTRLMICMCMKMSMCVVLEKYISYKRWIDVSSGEKIKFNMRDCENMIINIMRSVNCVIFEKTYWDYAESTKELIDLLEDARHLKYDASKLKNIKGSFDKDISTRDLVKLYNNVKSVALDI